MLAIIILLGLLTLAAISLQKSYYHIPAKELKRRAQQGDTFAIMLYRAVAYDLSLDVLLWLIIGACSSAFFVVVNRNAPSWLAVIGSISLLWLGFAWIPGTRLTRISLFLVRVITPSLTWVLRKLYPLLRRAAEFIRNHHPVSVHTGIYQKEDLLEILDQQKTQSDSRMTEDEIRVVRHALTFGDKLIREVMTPRRVVKAVKTTDSIGPILMGELHDSGFSRFPVYEDKEDNIVGTIYLRELVTAKAGGSVKSLMDKKVYYVNEEKPLSHALQAFLKTKHHLFIVVNDFEEMVGIVTIEDIIEQIIGKPIVDEFDKYEDLREVAKLVAQKDKQDRAKKQD